MMKWLISIFSCMHWLVFGSFVTAYAQSSPSGVSKGEGISYTYDESDLEQPSEELSYYSGIERMFKNPALQAGIANGAAALDRSIESLMEAIFYRMLDRQLVFKTNTSIIPNLNFGVKLHRDVFNTAVGTYVVADQFSIGPQYLTKLRDIGQIPLNLQIDSNVNVYNIYPRSDGMRLAEKYELPTWRYFLNNWFGILPLLTRILPPSFNPNELYDPVSELQTGFIFPSKPEVVENMPIGSIRSYSLTGSIALPVELATLLPKEALDQLAKLEKVSSTFPITAFISGENRISVLRRSDNVVWVGVNSVKRAGAGIKAEIGRVLKAFANVSPLWAGVDVPFFPLDFDWVKARALRFDQLYEFDLTNKYARDAYTKAVAGDFTEAFVRHSDRLGGVDTGVTFHFKKNHDAIESDDESSLNFFLFRKTREKSRSEGEIEINDPTGKYFVLDSTQETEQETWEVLTGAEQIAIKDSVEMRVERVSKDNDSEFSYRFFASDKNPSQFSISLNIQDRHTDAEELDQYMDLVRRFTKLKLSKVPKIPRRSEEKQQSLRMTSAAIDPTEQIQQLHVTPTFLGQFTANASVSFSNDVLSQICTKPEDEMWAAFASAFDKDVGFWSNAENRSSWTAIKNITSHVVAMPLRPFNIRFPSVDFYLQTKDAIAALHDICAAQTPVDKQDHFSELVSTNYPSQLTEAMLSLADRRMVPRTITFFTKPRGDADAATKEAFKSMNNQVVKSSAAPLAVQRHQIADEKLSAFFPSQLRQRGTKPIIANVSVNAIERTPLLPPLPAVESSQSVETEEVPAEQRQIEVMPSPEPSASPDPLTTLRSIQLELSVKNMPLTTVGKFYIRIESAGDVNVGRFVIAEQVLQVNPLLELQSDEATAGLQNKYQIILNGPNSPITSMITGDSVELDGGLQIHIAASADGKLWSDERLLKFRFENGKLLPPE